MQNNVNSSIATSRLYSKESFYFLHQKNEKHNDIESEISTIKLSHISDYKKIDTDISNLKDSNIENDLAIFSLSTKITALDSSSTNNKWLQDDLEQYPLLKSSTNQYNHWGKFKTALEDITLEDDKIQSLQHFSTV